jgi:hypothetical protein
VQVRTQSASVRQGEVKISLTEAREGKHRRSLRNIQILQVREEVKSRRIDAKIFGKKSLRT